MAFYVRPIKQERDKRGKADGRQQTAKRREEIADSK
jgi:hypothetical protein